MKKYLVLIFITVLFSSNYEMSKFCKNYKLDMERYQVDFSPNVNRIELDVVSSRNDFDYSMLIGFYAVGSVNQTYVLENKDNLLVVVNVTINAANDTYNIIGQASYEYVEDLATGRIESYEFIRKIKYL
ncbi:MAG: hypothetical protein CMF96_08625 [Candidatus Marinimicrobia bacterium]|nr:hypothetical protein [Candidatus Neomarinimicrobiota bacterium]MAJ44786.1 hypothetical protein [Candidatus Neomarinimicrobiota bacterium]|tara:strand:- start:584 stop:970 length:387 start_codon:yes stop_codon:yes gene_type:complete